MPASWQAIPVKELAHPLPADAVETANLGKRHPQ